MRVLKGSRDVNSFCLPANRIDPIFQEIDPLFALFEAFTTVLCANERSII